MEKEEEVNITSNKNHATIKQYLNLIMPLNHINLYKPP